MIKTYLFQTSHFAFRPILESDLSYLLPLDGDPETMQFFPGGARTEDEIKNKIKTYSEFYTKNRYGVFMVFDLNSEDFIGRAGFAEIENGEIEIGYLISKNYWGKGYATQMVKDLLTWANTHIPKDKIIAFTPANHIASERVMQKAGMTYVKKDVMKGLDCVIYEYKLLKNSAHL